MLVSTFRPVAFRLPLSAVAALAAAFALGPRAERGDKFRFGFRLQAPIAAATPETALPATPAAMILAA
jgi:hypothetical protein